MAAKLRIALMKKVVFGFIALAAIAVGLVIFLAKREPGSSVDQELIAAAHENNLTGLKAAIEQGANPNFKVQQSQWDKWFGEPSPELGCTALHYATQWGNVNSAIYLLEHGARVDEKSEFGNTPLILACQYIQKDMVRLLLKHKADPNIANKNGETALDAAVNKRGPDMELADMIRSAGGKGGIPSDQ